MITRRFDAWCSSILSGRRAHGCPCFDKPCSSAFTATQHDAVAEIPESALAIARPGVAQHVQSRGISRVVRRRRHGESLHPTRCDERHWCGSARSPPSRRLRLDVKRFVAFRRQRSSSTATGPPPSSGPAVEIVYPRRRPSSRSSLLWAHAVLGSARALLLPDRILPLVPDVGHNRSNGMRAAIPLTLLSLSLGAAIIRSAVLVPTSASLVHRSARHAGVSSGTIARAWRSSPRRSRDPVTTARTSFAACATAKPAPTSATFSADGIRRWPAGPIGAAFRSPSGFSLAPR